MLDEIKKQPDHIRSIFMWLSVFIVFSLVVFVWLQAFQQKLALLLNPSLEDSAIAGAGSPFAVIGGSFSDLGATISDLFGLTIGIRSEKDVKDNLEDRFGSKIEPRLLPVSE